MAVDAFAAEVRADGPIGYWRFGEPIGSAVAADASGNRNDGACSGPIVFGEPGFHGGDTAALFSSAALPTPSPRVVVLNSNSLNPANITMEAKVRWDGPNGLEIWAPEQAPSSGAPRIRPTADRRVGPDSRSSGDPDLGLSGLTILSLLLPTAVSQDFGFLGRGT